MDISDSFAYIVDDRLLEICKQMFTDSKRDIDVIEETLGKINLIFFVF